jgi:hypothetical protein
VQRIKTSHQKNNNLTKQQFYAQHYTHENMFIINIFTQGKHNFGWIDRFCFCALTNQKHKLLAFIYGTLLCSSSHTKIIINLKCEFYSFSISAHISQPAAAAGTEKKNKY